MPTQMFPHLPVRTTFVADTKNVSDFVQKHFVSATNVSQFAQPKKHHGQQCVLVYQGLKSLSLGTATGTAEFCKKTAERKCLNVAWFRANTCDILNQHGE